MADTTVLTALVWLGFAALIVIAFVIFHWSAYDLPTTGTLLLLSVLCYLGFAISATVNFQSRGTLHAYRVVRQSDPVVTSGASEECLPGKREWQCTCTSFRGGLSAAACAFTGAWVDNPTPCAALNLTRCTCLAHSRCNEYVTKWDAVRTYTLEDQLDPTHTLDITTKARLRAQHRRRGTRVSAGRTQQHGVSLPL
jgi:hypothetical protein